MYNWFIANHNGTDREFVVENSIFLQGFLFRRSISFVFASLKALPEFLQIRTATIPVVSSLNEAVSLYASLQAFAMSKAALRCPYARTCMLQDSIYIHCRVESVARAESNSLPSTACLGHSNTTSDHHSLPSTI